VFWLLRLCFGFCVCVLAFAFVLCTYGPPYVTKFSPPNNGLSFHK
jgi:hypothetical protein